MEGRDESSHWVALGNRAWHIETIWQAASHCPVEDALIDAIEELDEDCWFEGDGRVPTVRAVADHANRINKADLDRPIILSSDGHVLDGMHRVARALLDGHQTVKAQRLPVDPSPDWTLAEEA